jgi:zinc transport system ATP-binding protein
MRIMLNSEPTAPVVLAADDVSFAYGAEVVLDHVGLAVRAGEFAALAGPNGAGKSTLLRILLGLLAPQAGSVEVFGVTPSDLRDRWRVGWRSRVGGAVARAPTAPRSTTRSSRSR